MEKLKVVEAAKQMGVTQEFVRMGLRQNRLPFGAAVKMKGRWSYYINKTAFDTYINGSITHPKLEREELRRA